MNFKIDVKVRNKLLINNIPIPNSSFRFKISHRSIVKKIKKYTNLIIEKEYLFFNWNNYVYIVKFLDVNLYLLINAVKIK